jgi:hypothetical protein
MNNSIVAQEPRLEFVAEARVSVDKMLVVGDSSHGLRRIVPILGGSVEGPRLKGRVVPGGADWQFVRPDGVLELEAKYTLETHDGVLIMACATVRATCWIELHVASASTHRSITSAPRPNSRRPTTVHMLG